MAQVQHLGPVRRVLKPDGDGNTHEVHAWRGGEWEESALCTSEDEAQQIYDELNADPDLCVVMQPRTNWSPPEEDDGTP